MSLLSSLRSLVHRVSRPPRRGRPAGRNRTATFRPWLELLEDRAVPATVTWINPAGGAWNVPSNWDTGTLPGAADDARIPDFPGDITITHSTGTDTIRSLTSQEAVVLSGGSLSIGASGAVSTINGSFTVSGGTLALGSTTLNGSGTLTNSATLNVAGSTVNVPLVNQATLVAWSTNSLNGQLTTAAGSTLLVQAVGRESAVLTVDRGFTNNGAIGLTERGGVLLPIRDAGLVVRNGTLINAAGASISALPVSSPTNPRYSGWRWIDAQLDNQGILRVLNRLLVGNNGHILSNSGTIDIGADWLRVSGGTFNHQGGRVTGLGTLELLGVTANLTTAFTNAVTALTLSSSTVNGPGTLTNTPGKTLTMTSSTVNAPLVNQGALVAQATSAITSSLTTAAGSTLRVQGSNASDAVLTVANSFTNSGTIELTSDGASRAATLTVISGTLTNAAGANLSALAGTGGSRTLNAQLDNQGTLRVAQDLGLTNTGRTFSNSGTIDIASGRTLTVNGGLLTNFSAGTLTGGTYNIAGTFKFPDAAITTNAATIVLEGPNA
jgi:hypothetical protein